MMTKFGIVTEEGGVSRAEFVILCALRIGAIDQELVQEISKNFAHLDANNKGHVTHQELLNDMRRRSSHVITVRSFNSN